MRYYVENFGCQMNEHDMEKVNRLLHVAGFEAANDLEQAGIVIVNTCCVREKAEQKFYSLMGRLRRVKRRRGLVIGVMGCIAQLEKDAILEHLPFVDFSLGPSSIHLINDAVNAALKKEKFLDFSDNGSVSSLYVRPGNRSGSVKAYVTIMKGCNNFCSYCVVPYVRGREVSRASADIREEIEELASTGVKEVILLGQNVNSYNKGKDDLSFPELLRAINDIDGIERIRFITSHPRDFSDDLIDCFGNLEKLCEQIHLPFQSGSDRILGLMNRGYTLKEYVRKVDRLKSRCGTIAITADCIVGFPGEGDEDFRATMELVEKTGFDGVFSFCFSPRKYAKASALPDRVPRDVALGRLHELQALQRTITREKFRSMEGSKAEVLVEGLSKNSSDELTGRTRTNRIVNFKGAGEMIGRLVELEIVKGYANSLRGADPKLKEA
ncbi:MAG: (Dimethylallyl)adenosine tRNA methylthiotransferase MiaB [Syntrophorhabdaceae bacterium PtaU1.Bin034]|nr:MAG: (Dimethylallyl)adenosine tRNA methylthiotransferase MiaB [Syntrophorhabdaceae bacterium PtaU1.Bin034]